MENDKFIEESPVLFKKYRVKKKIGHGAFGAVYLGKSIDGDQPVAIKIEKKNTDKPLLEGEAYLLSTIKGIGIPQLLSYGKTKSYRALVEPLLGETLFDIFIKKGKQFPLAELCLIALQVLDRLQTLHCQYFIHRDIKPDNFLIGRKDPNIIYIIDFGLSKKYKSSQTRKHIKFRYTGKLTGTLRFASPNALKGGEQSRKDDLISAGYMIIYFMRKKLPWQFIKGDNSTDKYVKIYKMKKEIKPDKLCYNLPKQMTEYMKYVQHLAFEQEPDYRYLKNLFKSILESLHLDSDKLIFSWIKASDIKNLKKPVNPKSRKSSSRERLYKKIAENLKEKQRGTSSESSDNRSYEMIPNTINKADINNIKLQRNYSDENFDSGMNSNITKNNNTLLVNFDKTINNQLINKFENIDQQLESKEQSSNQNGELSSIIINKNNNDSSENNNKIFTFSRKINLELKNDKSKLQDNENDVSDVISRIKKEKENFYGKNIPNSKEIKNNDNENVIEKPKEKINNLVDNNNIIIKNKENKIESKNLINNNILEMINKQNNNNNKNNFIKNPNIENGGQNNFPKDENELIKSEEQLQKNNIKNNLSNLPKVNNNNVNKKNNNNILNKNKINTGKNIKKNLNNKNNNIIKNNNQLNPRIKPNLINKNKINANMNMRNFNNNINYINLTEPSDSILDDNIKMHKVQTEQNYKYNNIFKEFKEFNEKNNDINDNMDINFNLNKQFILNGQNKNNNQMNNKNIMQNNKNKVTTKKIVNKQINNNPSKITNMGEIKNKVQVKNINNNMNNINQIKNKGNMVYPRRIIMNNTNYPNNNNYINFNYIPNNNINYMPNNNIQNNNLVGQYPNYLDKYQQFNTVDTTGNNRQFRFNILNKEFNDFY